MAFVVDRVAELDRDAIRGSVLDRFSAVRMTDRYERLYRTMLTGATSAPPGLTDDRVTPLSAARSAGGGTRGEAVVSGR
jgi:hypothetical protein